MYDQVAEARHPRHPLPTRPFQSVFSRLQTRVADVIEMTERAENALKVTDDVYLARVYCAALELLRATSWRRGIERKHPPLMASRSQSSVVSLPFPDTRVSP